MKEGTLYTSASCTICGTYRGKNSWTTVNTDNDETVAICTNCYKPWLKDYDDVIPADILQKQRDTYKKK
jgi:transcription elongation factor Elf1